MSEQQNSEDSHQSSRFEMLCGLTLALLAAILAITDLGSGKFGDDAIIGHNQMSSAYSWYQSKSIKQSLAKGQSEMIKIFIDSGIITEDRQVMMSKITQKLDANVIRYKQEKKEILLGSSAVGKENWVLDRDGELGKIIGAKELEKQVDQLRAAGYTFDLATLYLQLCLVLGAISLLLKGDIMRNIFFGGMILLGAVGTVYSWLAFTQAGAFL